MASQSTTTKDSLATGMLRVVLGVCPCRAEYQNQRAAIDRNLQLGSPVYLVANAEQIRAAMERIRPCGDLEAILQKWR